MIKKGKQYRCVRWKGEYFKKGNVYKSPKDDYLIDEFGSETEMGVFKNSFQELPDPKFGDKVRCWDVNKELFDECYYVANIGGEMPHLVVEFKSEIDEIREDEAATVDLIRYMNCEPVSPIKEAFSSIPEELGQRRRNEALKDIADQLSEISEKIKRAI